MVVYLQDPVGERVRNIYAVGRFYFWLRRRRLRRLFRGLGRSNNNEDLPLSDHKRAGSDQVNPTEPHADNTEISESKDADEDADGLKYEKYSDRLKSLSTHEIESWIGFLSIYEQQGIMLRELIMLVSMLYSPICDPCKYPHWSRDGGHDLATLPDSKGLFLETLKEAIGLNELPAMEKRFLSLGLITVKIASQIGYDASHGWAIDNRRWCVRPDHRYGDVNNAQLCRDLLAVYSQIPDRDVHLMADPYREMFYYHAHAAIV